jgi:hypothetical protein
MVSDVELCPNLFISEEEEGREREGRGQKGARMRDSDSGGTGVKARS